METEMKGYKVITPEPFFEISFGCSNRSFYGVKDDLYGVAEAIGVEIEDGYINEKCDYEGDLEEITIYNNERGKALILAVLDFYGIVAGGLPEGMDIQLSIF